MTPGSCGLAVQIKIDQTKHDLPFSMLSKLVGFWIPQLAERTEKCHPAESCLLQRFTC